MPRKKIRIRNYPAQNIRYSNLEIKISAIEGRFKKSKKISNKDFKKMIVEGYIDHQYGPCMPKLIINYSREYYKIFNDNIGMSMKLWGLFKKRIWYQLRLKVILKDQKMSYWMLFLFKEYVFQNIVGLISHYF